MKDRNISKERPTSAKDDKNKGKAIQEIFEKRKDSAHNYLSNTQHLIRFKKKDKVLTLFY